MNPKYKQWLDITSAEVMKLNSGDYNFVSVPIGIIKDLVGDKIDTILSVGFGDGSELVFWGDNAQGIDMNDENIAMVKSAGCNVQKMDMHDMTFEDGKFDIVFSRDVFEHSISHIQVISEMARVSKRYVAIVLPDNQWAASGHHFIIPNLQQMISMGEKVGLSLRAYREYNILSNIIVVNQSLYLFEKHE